MVVADYEAILRGKYPAKAHARRVAAHIRSQVPAGASDSGVLYLESRMTKLLEDNDAPEPFRQRRHFFYLTGCPLADCRFVYDMDADKSVLFIPPVDPDSVIWSGLPLSTQEALDRFDVDEVRTTDQIHSMLEALAREKPSAKVYALRNQVLPGVPLEAFAQQNFDLAKEAIETCRVVKDEYELALMQKANDISAEAHHAVIKRARQAKNEQELEALFVERSMAQGAKNQSYHSILASGRAAATLHYVDNDKPLDGKLNLLVDAGAEWSCYASDITRTFPLSGHYLGMDTHDTGGNPNYEDPDRMFRYLRIRGRVPEGAVVTVEPGIYFCQFIIQPYLDDPKHAKYIDAKVLERYWDVGGVRIEDNLVITAMGSNNLTTVVKDREKLEAFLASE